MCGGEGLFFFYNDNIFFIKISKYFEKDCEDFHSLKNEKNLPADRCCPPGLLFAPGAPAWQGGFHLSLRALRTFPSSTPRAWPEASMKFL